MCTNLLLCKDLIDPLADSLQDKALLLKSASSKHPCTRDMYSRTRFYLAPILPSWEAETSIWTASAPTSTEYLCPDKNKQESDGLEFFA